MAGGAQDSQPDTKNSRQRKTHTKSRKGCKNCKIRRVKCDEVHPQCQRCIDYGTTCDYEGDGGDGLQIPGEGCFVFDAVPQQAPPGPEPQRDVPKDSMSPDQWVGGDDGDLDSLLNVPLSLHMTDGVHYINHEDIEIFRMFKHQTVFTVGTRQSVKTYRKEVINLANNASCLAHVVLTLTLMHKRYIDSGSNLSEPSEKESFHLYHGTAIFNDMLSKPIKEEDKDAIWGCAALLGAITIASMEGTTPEEAWPLKPNSLADLGWLRMSDGKKEVWRLTDPIREGSVWKEALSYGMINHPEPSHHDAPELKMLYPFLTRIYDFNPLITSAEQEQDPYHTAASILVRLLELDCDHSTIMYFLSFLGHMDPRFRELLFQKDPKALLLLAWWYAKMCQYNVWWQSQRMRLEGQAICLYLEKFHSDQDDIVKLLEYPKTMTGLGGT